MHYTNYDENNNEMDGVEVIGLCSIRQRKNDTFPEGRKQKARILDKSKYSTADKMEVELRTIRSKPITKNKKVESAMMCRESTSNFTEEEPHKEPEKMVKKPVERTEKQKHEEEHVEPTLNTGS